MLKKFTVANQEVFDSFVAANSNDGYSRAALEFACDWAAEAEKLIAQGQPFDVAILAAERPAESAHGITGFQYGCAVSFLARSWKHGEELRRWHNLRMQIGTEGEKANESGGVLNPAIINIG